MRATIAMILCLILCLSVLPMVASADTEDMVTICVKAPEGWSNVNIYWWGSATAAAEWPGNTLEKLSDGWFYGYIPKDVVNISLNNGSEQTEDLMISAGTANWVTINTKNAAGKYNATVTTEKQNTEQLPVYGYQLNVIVPADWQKVYVYAWQEGGDAFTAQTPGDAMRLDEQNGCYAAVLNAKADFVIISNGQNKTEAIAIGDKTQWIKIGNDFSYRVSDQVIDESSGTGDHSFVMTSVAVLICAAAGMTVLLGNRKRFL